MANFGLILGNIIVGDELAFGFKSARNKERTLSKTIN